MTKVVSLKGEPILDKRQPVPGVIAKAEWLLEAAKSGEIVGMAGVYYFHDEATGRFRAGTLSWSTVGRLGQVADEVKDMLK